MTSLVAAPRGMLPDAPITVLVEGAIRPVTLVGPAWVADGAEDKAVTGVPTTAPVITVAISNGSAGLSTARRVAARHAVNSYPKLRSGEEVVTMGLPARLRPIIPVSARRIGSGTYTARRCASRSQRALRSLRAKS